MNSLARFRLVAALAFLLPASARADSIQLIGTGTVAVMADPGGQSTTTYASSDDMAYLDLLYRPGDGTVTMTIFVAPPSSDDAPFVGPYAVTGPESTADWTAGVGTLDGTGRGGYAGGFDVGPGGGPGGVSAYLTISEYPVSYRDDQVRLTFQASGVPEPSSLVLALLGGLCVAGATIARRRP